MYKLKEDICNSKIRNSNIELLRILVMIMIIAHHFSVHGLFEVENLLSVNNIWLQILASGGKIAVNIFVMISGYFLISSSKIQTKKILKFLSQIWFYSLGIFMLFVISGLKPFSMSDLAKHIMGYPIWWFAKNYLALYLIHPYVNKCLNNLNKNEYQKLIVFSTILWSLIPTINLEPLDTGTLIWFIYIYIIGGYLKTYPPNLKCKTHVYFFTTTILYILTFLSVIILDYISIRIPFVENHVLYFFELEKLSTLLISIFLFLSFSNLEIKTNKIINVISSSTFGIYLIHDSLYVREFLWQTLFKNASYSNTFLLIPYSLLVITIVFIACSIIELLRIYIFEKQYIKLLEKISTSIDKSIDKILGLKFFNKL